VAEAWKIGRKKIDDGALLVIAKNDRRLRIEVGYGLEGALTDATTKRIIDEDITPKFKSGDFGGGVAAGVDKMVRVANGEKLPEPEPPHWRDSQSFDPEALFNPFLIIPAILFGGLLRSLMGRLLGSVTAGALTALIAWFLVGSVFAAVIVGVIASLFVLISDGFTSAGPGRRGSAGGWSGGSGGSWSSGGSSSSGGFSGGGGSFGGGGASGSW
ncbi:MAG TPA: TPM domain-containing protein, partial [Bradyrhizobium sp.]